MTAKRVAAERQASAGARDGVKGKWNDLAARAPLHALVGLRTRVKRADLWVVYLEIPSVEAESLLLAAEGSARVGLATVGSVQI